MHFKAVYTVAPEAQTQRRFFLHSVDAGVALIDLSTFDLTDESDGCL